jgi:hypothetical protein
MRQRGQGHVIDASRRWVPEDEDTSGEVDALAQAIFRLGRSLETEERHARGKRATELKRARRDLSKIRRRVARAGLG